MKRNPPRVAKAATAVSVAAANGIDRKNRRSISGSFASGLITQQTDQRDQGQRERTDDQGRARASNGCLDDAVGKRGEQEDHEHLAHRIDSSGLGGFELRDVSTAGRRQQPRQEC